MLKGVRTRLGLFLACMAAACGGHSTPVQPSTPNSLATGAYRLTLSMAAAGDPICTSAGCTPVGQCGSAGGVQPVGVFVPVDVRLERTGNDIAIRPLEASATFRMNLRISGIAISGTASGQFRSGVVVATDGGKPQTVAMVTGIAGPGHASGTLEGAITIDGAGCLNDAHRWHLDPPLPFQN